MSNKTIVFDTPEQIDMFRLLTLKSALKLKVNHGMGMSRGISLVKVAKGYGFTGRTNKAALAFVEALVAEHPRAEARSRRQPAFKEEEE